MTDQENKKPNKEGESFIETASDLVADVAESIATAMTAVADTVDNVLEGAIGNQVKAETQNQTQKDVQRETLNKENDLTDNVQELAEVNGSESEESETRVGYVPALPQANETEEEKIIDEPDDKDEIEAAIARARPTGEDLETKKDELVAETLPALPKRDRAWLQSQSPNRIFLYWSFADNPFETLHKAFGSRAVNYTLVTRLLNLNSNAESYAPANLQGDWWYNVRSNSQYRVDLGFYATNRPFIRLFSSNVVNTPRAAPSLRADTAEDWVVTKKQFQQVLEVSGYAKEASRAAFNVNFEISDDQTQQEELSTILVARRIAAPAFVPTTDLNLSELRWLIVSLAADISYEDLSGFLSEELIAWIEAVLASNPDAFSATNIRKSLESLFGAEFIAAFIEETARERLHTPIVFGASAIYFPEIMFPRLKLPELSAADRDLLQNTFDQNDFGEILSSPSSGEFLFSKS